MHVWTSPPLEPTVDRPVGSWPGQRLPEPWGARSTEPRADTGSGKSVRGGSLAVVGRGGKAEEAAVQSRLWHLAHHLARRSQAPLPEGGEAAHHRCGTVWDGQAVGRGDRPFPAKRLPGGAT